MDNGFANFGLVPAALRGGIASLGLLLAACGPTAAPDAAATPVAPATPDAPPSMSTPSRASSLLEAAPPRQSLNLIAYSDDKGRVMVVSHDGATATRITPDGGFLSWPMWSPSGDHIVFSGIPGDGGGPLELYAYRLGDEGPRVIFTNEPGAGPILPDMAHYPLWSPDGSRLALIASAQTRLTLFLADPFDGGSAKVVLREAPLYLSWSADSRHMVVHGGFEHFLVGLDDRIEVTNLGDRGVDYRVPAWRPTGDRYVLVSEDRDGRRGLYVAEANSQRRTFLEEG